MRIFMRIILVIFLIVSVFGLSKADAQFLFFGNPLEGKKAPDFTLATLKKDSVNMTEYREGKSAIVFFWTTWCPHCRSALRELDAQYSDLLKEGIKLILIDIEENKRQVASFIKRDNISLNIFLDTDGSVAGEYALVGVPTFYLIDKNGIVISVGHDLPEDYKDILTDL